MYTVCLIGCHIQLVYNTFVITNVSYCLFSGTSEAKKFSDLGADIAKCNVTPKVEVGFMMNCYKLFSFLAGYTN